jgi:hypothetical protein
MECQKMKTTDNSHFSILTPLEINEDRHANEQYAAETARTKKEI